MDDNDIVNSDARLARIMQEQERLDAMMRREQKRIRRAQRQQQQQQQPQQRAVVSTFVFHSFACDTYSQKKIYIKEETKTNKRQCPFHSVQVKIREGNPEGIRVTMEERVCERDEFYCLFTRATLC